MRTASTARENIRMMAAELDLYVSALLVKKGSYSFQYSVNAKQLRSRLYLQAGQSLASTGASKGGTYR